MSLSTSIDTPGDEIVLLPLGGAGEIGMNLYLYGYKGKWMIVDCGIAFGDDADPAVEVVMADIEFIEARKKDLVGIVLTHAHEDHLGAVPYLWEFLRCPVYATPFAATFLTRKLEEEGIDKDVPLKTVPLGGRVQVGPFDVQFVSLTHSIPEPNLLAIRTEHGIVCHTGDYKMDPDPQLGRPMDIDALKALGEEGVVAIVGDSTNVLSKGHSGSEADVLDALTEVIGRFHQRVAVTCFASNLARVQSVVKAAQANGRRVGLVGRSLWRMTEVAREVGYLKDIPPFLDEEEAAFMPDDKVLILCTGSQGEGRAALSRIAFDSHRHVVLDAGDAVIFSSKTIPGNEKSVLKVENQLARLGVHVVTDKMEPIHVSGHPKRDEVAEMYSYLKPRYAVPVHGESMHLLEHADFAEQDLGVEKAYVIENGTALRLAPGAPEKVGEVPTGRLIVDGDHLIPRDAPLMRDRRKIIYNGVAAVTVLIDGKGKLVGAPMVSAPGMLDEEDDAELIAEVSDRVADAVMALHANQRKRDDDKVHEAARVGARRAIGQLKKRRPVVSVHVVRLS